MYYRKTLSVTHELSFLFLGRPTFFYQSSVLSSRAVDGRQMYFGGSTIGKTSTIGIEISPTVSLIFTWGRGWSKVRNLASFKTSLIFEQHAFENAARCPNSETKVQCCDDRPV